MKREVRWLLLALSLALFVALSACSRKPSNDQAPPDAPGSTNHADEPGHDALPKRVRLDPSVIVDANIQTTPAAREQLAATIDLPGEIASDPDKTASVSPLVGGRIESVSFKEGQQVSKGDLLALVKVPELGKAKAAYTATQAKAIAARSNADRLQELADKRLAAAQEVLAAKAEADALDAEARAADDQLRALGTGATGGGSQLALRAPVSGIVISRAAIVGQPVTADEVIATIADLSEVWFLGRVFEKNLGQIRLGAPTEVQLNAYPDDRFSGTIEYLGKQVDPTARTVVARIRITNRNDLLRLGLFGVARVDVGRGDAGVASTLVVSRDAIAEIGGKTVVFVREPDGDFDLHDVVLGNSALGKVQILNGLRDGEQVVTQGVFTLKSAVLKSTFGGE